MMGNRFSKKVSNHENFNKFDETQETQRMVVDENEEFPLSQRRVIAQLVWRGQNFELYDGENFIGRDQQCEVVLDQKSVSSKHAELILKAGSATLRDLRSSNGTYVEYPAESGQYEKLTVLDNSREIKSGTRLRFGQVCCQFLFNGADQRFLETQFLDRKAILENDTLIDNMDVIESDATVGMTEDEDEETEPTSNQKPTTKVTALSPFKATTPQFRNPILDCATLVDPILDGPLEEEELGGNVTQTNSDSESTISQDLMAPIEEAKATTPNTAQKASNQTSSSSKVVQRKTSLKLDRTPTNKQLLDQTITTGLTKALEETPQTNKKPRGRRLLLETPPETVEKEPEVVDTSARNGRTSTRKSTNGKKEIQDETPAKVPAPQQGKSVPGKTQSSSDVPPPVIPPSTSKKRGRKAVLDEELADSVQTPRMDETTELPQELEEEQKESAKKKKRLSFNLESLHGNEEEKKNVAETTAAPMEEVEPKEEPTTTSSSAIPNTRTTKPPRGGKKASAKSRTHEEDVAEVPEETAVVTGKVANQKKPPTGRKGRASTKSIPEENEEDAAPQQNLPEPIRLLFTKIEESAYTKQLKKIPNIEITNDPTVATYCVTTKELKRTPKLMVGLNCVLQYIIHDQWIIDSSKQGKPIPIIDGNTGNMTKDTYKTQLSNSPYIVKDAEKEDLWNFHMINTLADIKISVDPASHQRLPESKVFVNYAFYVTDGVCGVSAPSEEDLIQIITSGGGSWMTTLQEYEDLVEGKPKPKKGAGKGKKKGMAEEEEEDANSKTANENKKQIPLIVISHPSVAKKEIKENMKDLVKKSGVKGIYSMEFIFKAVLRQKVDLNQDILDNYHFPA
jgi:hypothetical protein